MKALRFDSSRIRSIFMDEPKLKTVAARKVADRWTSNLAKRGWTPVADFFLDNYHRLEPPLKSNEAMFVIHLMRHKWDKNAPYPGFQLIAQRMGVSAEATRLYARSLEAKGYLFREMQIGLTNRFHLDRLFVALEKLMSKDDLEDVQRNHRAELLRMENMQSMAQNPAARTPTPAKAPPPAPQPGPPFQRVGGRIIPGASSPPSASAPPARMGPLPRERVS